MKIVRLVTNYFEENTYIVIDESTKQAAVIDPGMLGSVQQKTFDDYIAGKELTITQILLTHAHLDHCFGTNYVRNRYNVPVKAATEDAPLAMSLPEQSARFGIKMDMEPVIFDVNLSDGDIVEIGNGRLQVIATPGHSPGGVAFYDADDKSVFTGDSLFDGSIGRTDLEGGDHATLIESIKSKLLALPDDTVVLPGHGNHTTIGREKQSNPYL